MAETNKINLYLQGQDVFVWNAKDSIELREEWRIVGSLVGSLPRFPRQNNHLGLPLQLLPEETRLLLDKGICVLVKPKCSLTEPTSEQLQEHESVRTKIYNEQVELFREERKKEITRNLHLITEGKNKKRKQEVDRRKEAGEEVQETSVVVDVDEIDIPPVPLKNTLIQLYTEMPYNEELIECQSEWLYPNNENEVLRNSVFRDLWEKGYYLTSGSKFGGDFLVYPGDPARFHSFYIAVCRPHNQHMSALDFISLARIGSNVRKTVVLCSLNNENNVVYTSLQWTGIS